MCCEKCSPGREATTEYVNEFAKSVGADDLNSGNVYNVDETTLVLEVYTKMTVSSTLVKDARVKLLIHTQFLLEFPE